MTKKMVSISKKIFDLMGKYLTEFEKENGNTGGYIYIKHNKTGEIITFSIDQKTLEKNIVMFKAKEEKWFI